MNVQTAANKQSQHVGHRPGRRETERQSGADSRYAGILALQRSAGNQATTMLLRSRLQRQAMPTMAPGRGIHAGRPGHLEERHPLDLGVRGHLERQFGHSLGNLRVDTGETGRQIAARHQALAVSMNDTIYFGRGAYAPGTGRGDRVLRHEVVHYLQRPRAGRANGPTWSEPALEAEAHMAADRAGSSMPVKGSAPSGQPLFMKTYVSTVGGNPYLENAVKFYQLWENETAERVGSYQDIVEKLAAEKNPLPEFRVVAHGNGYNLFLPLLAGAKDYADLPALGLQTREALATRLGTTGVHLSADMTADVVKWLQAKNPGKALLARLGITTGVTGSLREWIWWAVDEYYAANVKEEKPDPAGPKQTSATERKSLQQEISKFQDAVRPVAEAALPTTAKTSDLEALHSEVQTQLSNRKWTWTALAGSLKETLGRMKLGDVTALRREAESGSFVKSLAAVKSWVNGKTYIEIRGCKIGDNDPYLKGIQEFFGTAPDRLPAISAPKLYQFFGLPGVQVFPEGGRGNPPVADTLKFLFQETFTDASLAKDVQKAIKKAGLTKVGDLAQVLKFADIKAEFEAWWTMKQRSSGVPEAKIQNATLKDFQDFLTTAPPRTFPVNAPGINAQSLWYFILLPSTAIQAILNWVKDQGYRLPGGKDPLKELFGGKKEWDAGRFTAGIQKLYVDWLGDEYPVPKKIYFREDPQYQQNIRRLPGTGQAKAKPAQPAQQPVQHPQ